MYALGGEINEEPVGRKVTEESSAYGSTVLVCCESEHMIGHDNDQAGNKIRSRGKGTVDPKGKTPNFIFSAKPLRPNQSVSVMWVLSEQDLTISEKKAEWVI